MLKTSLFKPPPSPSRVSRRYQSLDLRIHFIGLKCEILLAEVNVCKEDDEDDLKSQSSTFFGTQTSNRIWPRIPWALTNGGVDRGIKLSLGVSWTDPTSLPSWYSTDPGTTKWSFKSRVILWQLWYWFKLETASLRWCKGSDILLWDPPTCWVLCE